MPTFVVSMNLAKSLRPALPLIHTFLVESSFGRAKVCTQPALNSDILPPPAGEETAGRQSS